MVETTNQHVFAMIFIYALNCLHIYISLYIHIYNMCCFPHGNMFWAGGKIMHMLAVTEKNRSVAWCPGYLKVAASRC